MSSLSRRQLYANINRRVGTTSLFIFLHITVHRYVNVKISKWDFFKIGKNLVSINYM